jgi:pSer/pThr/pTyr-binding forkhead associated (FHA) protein
MQNTPNILVQLVHIKGPFQGEIQEFSESEILIGRHKDCHVRFPKDLAIVSRIHARIAREGNRFKLIDKSANGTYLNNKLTQEAYLKNGDVLLFAEGGPKVSFLTKILEARQETPVQPEVSREVPEQPKLPPREKQVGISPQPPVKPKPRVDVRVDKMPVPLVIQLGPTLQSFKDLPVTIGRNPDCDFVIDHPAIAAYHARFFFTKDQYWIKDLTGQNNIRVNDQPIGDDAPLETENRISLSSQGPSFRFLGAGRLAEIEEDEPEPQAEETPVTEDNEAPPESAKKFTKASVDYIKKFLKE